MKPASKKIGGYEGTAHKKAKFLEAYSEGISIQAAAGIAGCCKQSIYAWQANDLEFAAQMELRRGAVELELIRKIRAGEKSWQAAAWMLSRKWPSLYGDRAPDPSQMTEEEIERFLSLIPKQLLEKVGAAPEHKGPASTDH